MAGYGEELGAWAKGKCVPKGKRGKKGKKGKKQGLAGHLPDFLRKKGGGKGMMETVE